MVAPCGGMGRVIGIFGGMCIYGSGGGGRCCVYLWLILVSCTLGTPFPAAAARQDASLRTSKLNNIITGVWLSW